MKLHLLAFVTLICCLLSCQPKNTEVTISGKVMGGDKDLVTYTLPIKGISSYSFTDTVRTDSLGHFLITLDTEEPCFVKVYSLGKFSKAIIIEKGMHYDITFAPDSGEGFLERSKKSIIMCSNKEGQDAYNALPDPPVINYLTEEYIKDTIPPSIASKLAKRKHGEMARFDTLLESGAISRDFYDLVKLDRDCFYAGVQGQVAMRHISKGAYSKERKVSPKWQSTVLESFDQISNENMIRSTRFFPVMKNYVNYEVAMEYAQDPNEDMYREIGKNGLYNTFIVNSAKKQLPRNLFEVYFAQYLYNQAFQKKYEEELISLFDSFKTEFPESEFTKFIEPKITPVVAFHQNKKKPFSEGVTFVDDYESISTLEEALSSFKGKAVFIDVWATWCGPCKEEFAHKSKLKEVLKKHHVDLLYISIDKEVNDTQWKDMIKYFDLDGHHIRVNENLGKDLRVVFDRQGSISIPWYILVNKYGKIVVKHASRPSSIDELENEIKANLDS